MASLPLSQFPAGQVALVATDMDGTLTAHGRFTPQLLQALGSLAAANIPVLIVTGRSAGWVQAIAHYLPIAGAIAENGGVYMAPAVRHLSLSGGDRESCGPPSAVGRDV
jgi:hydroxymethylpyrimidine pyrophosphatase-like HAD family hydrolase